jgi:exopolysaccharide biosynthesis polyprenyl glycosylphosphotransferase
VLTVLRDRRTVLSVVCLPAGSATNGCNGPAGVAPPPRGMVRGVAGPLLTKGTPSLIMLNATYEYSPRAAPVPLPWKGQLKVRARTLARPRRAFLAAELILLSAVLVQTAWAGYSLGGPVLVAMCALLFHVHDLDRSVVTSEARRFWRHLCESAFLGVLVSASLFFLFPGLRPRVSVGIVAGLLVVLLPVMVRFCLQNLVSRGTFGERVLIVGTGDLPARLDRALGRDISSAARNTRMLNFPDRSTDRVSASDLAELTRLVVRDRISRVVIADVDPQSRDGLAVALLDSGLRGLQVEDAVDFYEEFTGKIWIEALNLQWFMRHVVGRSWFGASLKRSFDVAFASVLILFAGPLLGLIALAIKFESAGPVLFRQVRVGLYGKTFVIYKFRSMRDGEERGSVPSWTSECDKRVTRVGRLLRACHLDELPQAFNVLRGNMSMVGPRPERPCFVEQLESQIPFYNLRHYLKPGITGWAQVMYKYGASVQDSYEKLQYDFYYAKHNSFRCDAAILVKTVGTVLFGGGR